MGSRKTLKKGNPRQPTEEERREHEMTHIPFRNWCRHCVRGRGKEEDHRNMGEEERTIPQVNMDFMFMGEENSSKTVAFSVARERENRKR